MYLLRDAEARAAATLVGRIDESIVQAIRQPAGWAIVTDGFVGIRSNINRRQVLDFATDDMFHDGLGELIGKLGSIIVFGEELHDAHRKPRGTESLLAVVRKDKQMVGRLYDFSCRKSIATFVAHSSSPDTRFFLRWSRVGDFGVAVTTIYAKHVYILTYSYKEY